MSSYSIVDYLAFDYCKALLAEFRLMMMMMMMMMMMTMMLMMTQVNGAPVVAEDQSSYKKPDISIVINEERYVFVIFFLASPYTDRISGGLRLISDLKFSAVCMF